jgi:hypothetical protein
MRCSCVIWTYAAHVPSGTMNCWLWLSGSGTDLQVYSAGKDWKQ